MTAQFAFLDIVLYQTQVHKSTRLFLNSSCSCMIDSLENSLKCTVSEIHQTKILNQLLKICIYDS